MALTLTISNLLQKIRDGLQVRATGAITGADPEWLALQDLLMTTPLRDAEPVCPRNPVGDAALLFVRAL